MRLIVNEIVKLTNLKDKLLLSEGLGIVVIMLSHCFILHPMKFVLLPSLFIPLPVFLSCSIFDWREMKLLPAPMLCDDVAAF
jgi:hypothetical protein